MKKIDVVFEAELRYDSTDKQVDVSSYKGFYVPGDELLPEEKDAVITSQAYADWLTFNESVEDLITDYYGLDIICNIDDSFYFGVLARSNNDPFILNFSATFRIANHDTSGKKLQVIYKPIIVNQNSFSSYYEAFVHVSDEIEKASKVLKRDIH